MESRNFVQTIKQYVESRFMVNEDEEWKKTVIEIPFEKNFEKDIIQLKRFSTNSISWRTFLIVVLVSIKDLEDSIHWAASVRDELLDPETADLYLIIAIEDPCLTLEKCINIESDEKYCRKYVLRPKETFCDLLDRTCLALADDLVSNIGISDPLLNALNKASKTNKWLNDHYMEKWRTAFLSGKNGEELIDILFTD